MRARGSLSWFPRNIGLDGEVSVTPVLLFLPGAGGNTRFWQRVSERLQIAGARIFFGWPGFAGVPEDPGVRGFEDLVGRVLTVLNDNANRPVHVLAQSMGGAVALHATLKNPARVTRLVLSATSGGVDVSALGGSDWRPDFMRQFPNAPTWFATHRSDLSEQLKTLDIPTLLLWGDADPISPVAVGEHLKALLPNASLRVLAGADHDLVDNRADDVAPYIAAHLELNNSNS
jgi:pimeloyl-ACP methyl ester carboxylesterase